MYISLFIMYLLSLQKISRYFMLDPIIKYYCMLDLDIYKVLRHL